MHGYVVYSPQKNETTFIIDSSTTYTCNSTGILGTYSIRIHGANLDGIGR